MLKITRTRGTDLVEIKTKKTTLALLWAEMKDELKAGDIVKIQNNDHLMAWFVWDWQHKRPTIRFHM